MTSSAQISMNDIISLCKRRGFLFQSSEIYGGLQGVYDYGPLGIELKNNIKISWWKENVHCRDDVEGMDSAILTHQLVLTHSGHKETFCDMMVDCRNCKTRMRSDHVIENKCSNCKSSDLTEARPFNLLMQANFGPISDDGNYVYLRPETAQGIFTNFRNVINTTNRKLPFGIAQIGKSFRNEITPKHFIFRIREFEQMEIEFFVKPENDEEWHKRWIEDRLLWWYKQGIKKENLRVEYQKKEELAHYAKSTADILYKFPHGFEELEGIANRTDYDLASHSKNQKDFKIVSNVTKNDDSNTSLEMSDPKTGSFIPFIIEPSAGLERGFLAILTESYCVEELDDGKSRVVLKLKPHLAPFKIFIIPLLRNNTDITDKAYHLSRNMRNLGIGRVKYEDVGNIGKAYRRADEIGVPICITVDFQSLEDNTITLRERDSMKQRRMHINELSQLVLDYFR